MVRLVVPVLLMVTVACGPELNPRDPAQLSSADDGLGSQSAAPAAAKVHFSPSTVSLTGTPTEGGTLELSYDEARLPQCRGTLNDGRPAWSITGFASLNGAPATSFPVAGFSPDGKPLPTSTPIPLAEQGELQVWFQITNIWGCSAWDSDYGRNFRFAVATKHPNPADWVGKLRVNISRTGGGCASARTLQNGTFRFDTWARSRAVDTMLCFEAWEPSVTDWANPDLWKQLDARFYYRFGNTGPFQFAYVPLDGYVGNNARYRVELRGIDPFRPYQSGCPAAPLTRTADGFYVTTQMQYYLEVNGRQLRPAPGANWVGHFEDHQGPYAHCP